MKMMYNGTEIKSLNIKHYEIDSNFATVEPSDMQAGKTAVARGEKITGTGKSFEFASYATTALNYPIPIPANINVIELASTTYPVTMAMRLIEIKNIDFSTDKTIGSVMIDSVEYPISMVVSNNIMTISCDKNISLELFYGKDNYV